MRAKESPEWTISDAAKARLRLLIDAVPEDAGDDDPALLTLLEAWDAVKGPYSAQRGVIPAYKCRGGNWLHAGRDAVIRGIEFRIDD